MTPIVLLQCVDNIEGVYTSPLHSSLVLDAIKNVTLAILILLLEDQGCDLNQEAGQLGLHCNRCHERSGALMP